MNKKNSKGLPLYLRISTRTLLLGALLSGGLLSVSDKAHADNRLASTISVSVDSNQNETNLVTAENVQTANLSDPDTKVNTVWTVGMSELDTKQFKLHTDGFLHYPYQSNQGWYNITKSFNGRDNLLCAAATAGNMLHWWFDQNEDQIKKYLDKYPEKANISFREEKFLSMEELIKTKDKQKDSALFTYFQEKAFPDISRRNTGLIVDRVLDMFINGYYLSINDLRETNTNNLRKDNRGGVFDHVFKRGDSRKKLTSRHDLDDKSIEEIGQLIRRELEAGKALAISYTYAGIGMAHVVNLWGADFDQDGKLVAIYVADSDNSTDVGMKKYYVGKNKEGHVAISAQKVEGDVLGSRLLRLGSLSSGKDMWPAQY
ncbi:IdeS/Mac family cysteine endopeptidase [Streptococcus phocae subsp. phocae]